MFSTQLFLAIVLLVGASARHIQWEDTPDGIYEEYRYEEYRYPVYDVDEDVYYQHPSYLSSARVRRQAQGSLTLNSDGSTTLKAKVPLVGNDKNVLSAIGSVGVDNKMNTASKSLGLALDNVNGHSLSVMKETIPGFGSRLTGNSVSQ